MFFHWLKDYGKGKQGATDVVNAIFTDAQAASPDVFAADSTVRTLQQAKFEHMCVWAAFYLVSKEPQVAKAVLEELVDRLEIGLREGGVGDMKVGVHVRKHAAALHGRVRRYATLIDVQDWDGLALAVAEHSVDGGLVALLREKTS